MRIPIALVLILSFLLPQTALAEDPPAIPPGDDHIVAMRKGDPAPFTGQLFDQETSLRWANWLVQYKVRMKLDHELQEKICKADIELRDRKLELEREQYKKVVEDYDKKLAALQDPPFYKTPGFAFGGGVVVTVVAIVATAVVVNAAK